jgi:glycosyltransferase involved in cell wall biosynthesis
MDIDKITVALATYRRPAELHLALEALARQEFKRLCVIISDDAPNEVNRLRVSAERRFEVEYLPNSQRKGVLLNHLSMIDKARSDMFMFHGDDDELLPNALSSLSEPLKTAQDYDGVFSNYRVGPNPKQTHQVAISSLPFVRYWRHHYYLVRFLAYYLCPAFLGKQNLFYAMYRTEAVRRINVNKALPPRNYFLNFDEMFSFQAVCNGPVLVIANQCYFFAEGNTKHYADSNSLQSGAILAISNFIKYEWVTLFDYLRNVNGAFSYWLVLILFPVKFLIASAWLFTRWVLKAKKVVV